MACRRQFSYLPLPSVSASPLVCYHIQKITQLLYLHKLRLLAGVASPPVGGLAPTHLSLDTHDGIRTLLTAPDDRLFLNDGHNNIPKLEYHSLVLKWWILDFWRDTCLAVETLPTDDDDQSQPSHHSLWLGSKETLGVFVAGLHRRPIGEFELRLKMIRAEVVLNSKYFTFAMALRVAFAPAIPDSILPMRYS